jgi:ribosomal protein S25
MKSVIKVERYLHEHKSPVTAKRLANHFGISQATASQALRDLERDGTARLITTVNRELFYVANRKGQQ